MILSFAVVLSVQRWAGPNNPNSSSGRFSIPFPRAIVTSVLISEFPASSEDILRRPRNQPARSRMAHGILGGVNDEAFRRAAREVRTGICLEDQYQATPETDLRMDQGGSPSSTGEWGRRPNETQGNTISSGGDTSRSVRGHDSTYKGFTGFISGGRSLEMGPHRMRIAREGWDPAPRHAASDASRAEELAKHRTTNWTGVEGAKGALGQHGYFETSEAESSDESYSPWTTASSSGVTPLL
ncbi:hypothetical protein FB451DRAFT_1491646 [Mycena latifolia]|nr:hypothetical protein FB451DRAFT_1491646 [Mycena latifolia]